MSATRLILGAMLIVPGCEEQETPVPVASEAPAHPSPTAESTPEPWTITVLPAFAEHSKVRELIAGVHYYEVRSQWRRTASEGGATVGRDFPPRPFVDFDVGPKSAALCTSTVWCSVRRPSPAP